MALTYSTDAKAARMTATAAQIDAGTGAGKLKIRDASNNILSTHTLADPCGSVAGDTLTLDFDPDLSATASGSGVADNAIITDSADTTVLSGLTVGTTGTHVVLDSVNITAGQTVILATGTITHAA